MGQLSQASKPAARQLVVVQVEVRQAPELLAAEAFDLANAAGRQVQLTDCLEVRVANLLLQKLRRQPPGVPFPCRGLLRRVDAHAVQYLETAQVVHRVQAVGRVSAQRVAGQVQDDEFRQLLQEQHLLDVGNLVVPNVQLHERRQPADTVQRHQLVVLQAELAELHQAGDALDASQAVFAKVQLLQEPQRVKALHARDAILLQRQLLQHRQCGQALDGRQLVVGEVRATQALQALKIAQSAQAHVGQVQRLHLAHPLVVSGVPLNLATVPAVVRLIVVVC